MGEFREWAINGDTALPGYQRVPDSPSRNGRNDEPPGRLEASRATPGFDPADGSKSGSAGQVAGFTSGSQSGPIGGRCGTTEISFRVTRPLNPRWFEISWVF